MHVAMMTPWLSMSSHMSSLFAPASDFFPFKSNALCASNKNLRLSRCSLPWINSVLSPMSSPFWTFFLTMLSNLSLYFPGSEQKLGVMKDVNLRIFDAGSRRKERVKPNIAKKLGGRPMTEAEQQAMMQQMVAQQKQTQARMETSQTAQAESGFVEDDPSTWGNPGRNDPCPCGSGKKFKHCHGRLS